MVLHEHERLGAQAKRVAYRHLLPLLASVVEEREEGANRSGLSLQLYKYYISVYTSSSSMCLAALANPVF